MYLVISFVVLIMSYCLFRKAAGTMALKHINMVSFTFYILVMTVFIGSLLIVFQIDNQGYLYKISNEEIRVYGWLGVLYTMIMMPIGMLITSQALNEQSIHALFGRHAQAPLRTFFRANDDCIRHALYVASFLSILALLYTIYRLQTVPLLNALASLDDPRTLAIQRTEARLEPGMFSNLLATQLNFTPLIAYIAHLYWKMEKRYKDLIWFLFMFVVSIVSLTYNLTKGDLVLFILGFPLMAVVIKGKVALKYVATTLLAISVILVVLYVSFKGYNIERTIDVVELFFASILVDRIITGQVLNYYYCLDIFPDVYSHIGFSSAGRLMHQLFRLEYSKDYGLIVMEYYDPINVEQGLVGHASTFFMGEAWANFGLIGVIVAPVYVGLFIQACYICFLKLKKTPIHVAAYAFISIRVIRATLTGFIGFYYPVGHVLSLLMLLCWVVLASILKSSTARVSWPHPEKNNILSSRWT